MGEILEEGRLARREAAGEAGDGGRARFLRVADVEDQPEAEDRRSGFPGRILGLDGGEARIVGEMMVAEAPAQPASRGRW